MVIRKKMFLATACMVLIAQHGFGQSKSSVQFYDTTGANKTGKIGWSGDATSGHFFIQTPNEGELIKSSVGGVSVNGTVTATKYTGDGSGLANLPSPAVSVGTVAGLQDSLKKKADTTWVNGKFSVKADTGWVNTKVANIGTAQIPDGSVTTAKIADSAVTTAKIKDRVVTDAKIDSVSFGKIKGMPAYAAASHTHTIANVTGLTDSIAAHRTLINGKANASDLTALQGQVGGKADTAWVNGRVGGCKIDSSLSSSILLNQNSFTEVLSTTINIPSEGFVIVQGSADIYYSGGGRLMQVRGFLSLDGSVPMISRELYQEGDSLGQIIQSWSDSRGITVSSGNHTLSQ